MFWDIQEAIYFSTQNLQNINYLRFHVLKLPLYIRVVLFKRVHKYD